MTTQQEFLDRMPTAEARQAAERLMRVARHNGGRVNWEKVGFSIRCRCPVWEGELSVAWIYPFPSQRGFRNTTDFSFGAGGRDSGFFERLPDQLRELLEDWAGLFSRDGFSQDVSKLKPRWDVHSRGDEDWLGCASEALSSVLGE